MTKYYDFSEIRICFDQSDEDGYCLKLCLEITLYYTGGFKVNAEGILNFYHNAIEIIGKNSNYYDIDGKNQPKKIKNRKEILEILPHWVKTPERDIYGFTLESGNNRYEVSDQSFDFYNSSIGNGHIRLLLPLEYMNDSVEPFINLAKRITENLHFLSGHGGFGTNMTNDYHSQFEEWPVYALSRRYRGVDFGEPHIFSDFMTHGIKSINWLTFLGNDYVAQLGGKDDLKNKLGNGIIVHELKYGIMIQAGPQPLFGDVNRNENLFYYYQVGTVLKELRIPKDILREYDGIGGTENTEEWLNRFFEERD